MNFVLAFFIALVFVGLAVYAVWKGEAPFRGPGRMRMQVRRSKNPVGFWLVIAMYVTIAGLTIWIGARQALAL